MVDELDPVVAGQRIRPQHINQIIDYLDDNPIGDGGGLTEEQEAAIAAIPTGGTDGQALVKTSGTDYDTAWETVSGGSLPSAPSDDSILANVMGATVWRGIRRKRPADYGAVGDGTNHLLSEEFGTLGAAQAAYPDAGIAATTESLDLAAMRQLVADAGSGDFATHRIELENMDLAWAGTLTIPYRHGTWIEGDGEESTSMRQFTANTPILRFVVDPAAHVIAVEGLAFIFNTQSANTATSAIGIELWSDDAGAGEPNELRFERLISDGCYNFMKTTNTAAGNTVPFMMRIADIWAQRMSGHVLNMQYGSGKVGVTIDGLFVSAASGGNAPTVPAIKLAGFDVIAERCIFDAWPTVRHAEFEGTTAPLILRKWEMGESMTYPQGSDNEQFIYVANQGVYAEGITFNGTINKGAYYAAMFKLDGNTGTISELKALHSGANALSSGSFYPVEMLNGALAHVSDCRGGNWTAAPIRTAHADSVAGLQSYNGIPKQAKGFVNHGATAATARPATYVSVEWLGSVEPDNMINGDTWVVTA